MPALTLTRAAELARPLGYTIRRTQDSEVVAYRKGTGQDAPHAYFTDDVCDALATVAAMAVNEGAEPSDVAAACDATGVRVVPVRGVESTPSGPICALCGVVYAPDAGTFKDWAADYGYDTDSIAARDVYDSCLRTALAMRAGFGGDGMAWHNLPPHSKTTETNPQKDSNHA